MSFIASRGKLATTRLARADNNSQGLPTRAQRIQARRLLEETIRERHRVHCILHEAMLLNRCLSFLPQRLDKLWTLQEVVDSMYKRLKDGY